MGGERFVPSRWYRWRCHLGVLAFLSFLVPCHGIAICEVLGLSKQYRLTAADGTVADHFELKAPTAVNAVFREEESETCSNWLELQIISANGVEISAYLPRPVLLPAGTYQFVARLGESRPPGCEYEMALVFEGVKSGRSLLGSKLKPEVIDLYKESLLRAAVIQSDVNQSIEVNSIRLLFLDGVAAERDIRTLVNAACKRTESFDAKWPEEENASGLDRIINDRYKAIVSLGVTIESGGHHDRSSWKRVCTSPWSAKIKTPRVYVEWEPTRNDELAFQLAELKMAILLRRLFGLDNKTS